MNLIYVLNGAAVGVYGMVLAASFCDILWTKQKKLAMAGGMAAILLFQGLVYFYINSAAITYLYPAITHIPLTVLLCFLSKKCLWSMISTLTAYLCCQLRRWIALLVVGIVSGDPMMQNIVELVVTFPLLFCLLRFVAPSVRSLSRETKKVQWRFGMIPALGYGFDYLTRIYTDLLSEGAPAAVEFMPFVCSVAYLMFVLRTSEEKEMRSRLEQTQDSLNLQMAQVVREIEALRKSQQTASTYRHDLRHHMQYLLACVENGKTEQAQTYIHEICSEIEANKVTVFCENEAANLIFSVFASRSEESGIPMKIQAQIPQIIPVSESDLCVCLSNALENALHACKKVKAKGTDASIEVTAYEKNGKFFFQCINSCEAEVAFSNGIPVTDEPGHGIGVRSICAIVERYRGLYSFEVRDGSFVLRLSL